MAIDHDPRTIAREPADDELEREEQLHAHLRASLALAEELLEERRARLAPRWAAASAGAEGAALAEENRHLEARVRELSLVVKQVEARALGAEQDLSDVANVYIASSQLHVGLAPARVLAQIGELMGQLVGAECFVVYVLSRDGRSARPVSFEGIAEGALSSVTVGAGVVGEVLLGGEVHMRLESPLPVGSLAEPLAIIPLLVSGQAIGAVSVLRLLPQKKEWVAVDHELFTLLSHHAGVALLTAHLFRQQPDLLSALAGLGEGLA